MIKRIACSAFVLVVMVSSGVGAASLIERFESPDMLSHGTLVMRSDESDTRVLPATIEENARVNGVAIDENNQELFQLRNDGNNLNVITDGVVDALVTDTNGTIASGDLLSVSRIAGVAAKQSGQSKIVASAIESFSGAEDAANLTTVELDGEEVAVGRIQVRVELRNNPYAENVGFSVPGFVQQAGNALAGKTVEPARALAAFISIIITLAFSITLFVSLHASVRGSLSRNPDSSDAVVKTEKQLFFLVGIVAVTGMVISYLILSLG